MILRVFSRSLCALRLDDELELFNQKKMLSPFHSRACWHHSDAAASCNYGLDRILLGGNGITLFQAVVSLLISISEWLKRARDGAE